MHHPFQSNKNDNTSDHSYNYNNESFNTSINHSRNIQLQRQPPKPCKPKIDAQTIFSDPCSSSDPRWFWRTNMESSRKDSRNMKHYVNYVGSKGARSFEKHSNSCDKKPDHYKKHLAKIGCPLHDLYDIFHNDLGFTVNPTICAHKSWKCPSFSSYSNYNLFSTISMSDIGLEWKRGAFSVKPLHIEYDNIFSTDLYIKRIANTNFNKVFRPGCFGNLPSVKKGSWKQGKVFYVFKNDKLVLNMSNNIILIFELASPSTIIKSNKNKHDIIDGWKDIVGGVGFYVCKETAQNIATVLILRKSTEFPIECIQQSKVKILIKSNINNNFYGKKLIIGSKSFQLNDMMDTISIASSSTLNNNGRHGRDRDRHFNNCLNNSSDSRSRSRTRDRRNKNSGRKIINVDSYGNESPGCSVGTSDRSVRSCSSLSYDYGNSNVSTISMENNNYGSPFYTNNGCNENNIVDNKLDTIIGTMRNKFEHDKSILSQQNQMLNGKIVQLQTLNAQFMDLNSKLMQERDQLLNQMQTLQNRQSQRIHNYQPPPMSQPNCMMNSIANMDVNIDSNINVNMNDMNEIDNDNMDMNFNYSTMPIIPQRFDDNNSIFNTDPMFYGTYTECEETNTGNEFQSNSAFF